jgi:serine/threonine-protein kinase RsbW
MVRTVSDFAAARIVQGEILDEADRQRYSEDTAFAIRLGFEEAMNNALRHGNAMDPGKVVCVECDIDARRAIITVTDQGEGFDPASVPDPTCDENLEKPCGRGLMLMRAYMDKVTFNECGNQVCLVKYNRP